MGFRRIALNKPIGAISSKVAGVVPTNLKVDAGDAIGDVAVDDPTGDIKANIAGSLGNIKGTLNTDVGGKLNELNPLSKTKSVKQKAGGLLAGIIGGLKSKTSFLQNKFSSELLTSKNDFKIGFTSNGMS